MSFGIGDTVGEYQVIDTLGAGGMGKVFKVRHVISERIEALKILLPNLQNAPDLAERFVREIKIQASLNHPNIAALHTAFRADNQLLMVMEYVEGEPLSERMRTSGIELWEGVGYIVQVLAALTHAHGSGVVHRDIKPANIIIAANGRVKVLDFGIASASREQKLTLTGAVLGSLHYMSPEQVNSQQPDERSDIYSVGATLYELITGRHAIQGQADYAIMTGHLVQTPDPPHEVNRLVPPALSDIVLKSLAKAPADRFQKAEHFLTALQGLGRVVTVADSPPIATRMTSPPTPTPTGLAIEGWDPAMLQNAAKALAPYVGPIAKILVQRAAKQTSNVKELYRRLSEEIASEEDRKKFLAT